jgi:hypothetical protein
MHVLLEEKRRQKKLVVNLKKSKQQGWFKPGTEPQSSVSISTSGSGSRSETRPQNTITAGSRSRKLVPASHGMGDDEGDSSNYGHLPRPASQKMGDEEGEMAIYGHLPRPVSHERGDEERELATCGHLPRPASHEMGDEEGELSIYGHLPRCPTTITAGSRSRKQLKFINSAVASPLSRRSRPEHPAHRSGGGLKYNDLPSLS